MYSSLARTPKLQLAAEQLLTGECWISPKKMSHVQRQRKSPNKMAEGEKSHLESNPPAHQRCSEGSNKTVCTPEPRGPTETELDLPLSV